MIQVATDNDQDSISNAASAATLEALSDCLRSIPSRAFLVSDRSKEEVAQTFAASTYHLLYSFSRNAGKSHYRPWVELTKSDQRSVIDLLVFIFTTKPTLEQMNAHCLEVDCLIGRGRRSAESTEETSEEASTVSIEDMLLLTRLTAVATKKALPPEPAKSGGYPDFTSVQESIQTDAAYAWSWHCNLAVPIMDSIGVSHAEANKAADRLMQHLFGVSTARVEANHFAAAKSEEATAA